MSVHHGRGEKLRAGGRDAQLLDSREIIPHSMLQRADAESQRMSEPFIQFPFTRSEPPRNPSDLERIRREAARALGMEVIAFDAMMAHDHPAYATHGARAMGFDELVATADVISLHVPLVDSTHNLFDAKRIAGDIEASLERSDE